jgi:ribosomal protein S18 acetylase RimI-like enzyme
LELQIRPFESEDIETILDIAVAAWQPVFESTREIVGGELYDLIYADPDARKRRSVAAQCAANSPTLVWVAELRGQIAGFVTLDMNSDTLVGEIGNNAVSPAHQHQGIGTQMYDFVLAHMKELGMKSAVVTTGGDEAHAPARRAYEKAGFAGAVPSVEYHIKF